MVLHFMAAGRLSGRFRRSGSLCAASRGDGGGEPAGRVPVFCLTEGFPNSLRTISGVVSCRFAVCLSVQWTGRYSSFFFSVLSAFCWMRRSPLCDAEAAAETQGETPLRSLRATPDPEIVSGRTGDRNAAKQCIGAFGCGDAALAAVAAENPPSKSGKALSASFRSYDRNATVRVDRLGRDDGSRRTTVRSDILAATNHEQGIVLVRTAGGKYQLAQRTQGRIGA